MIDEVIFVYTRRASETVVYKISWYVKTTFKKILIFQHVFFVNKIHSLYFCDNRFQIFSGCLG